ncbi:MAG: hypothetical protein H6R16_2851 [Proteobacteria bacterium]|nr:hypothetical protein [Pseudomonadota bacterium]
MPTKVHYWFPVVKWMCVLYGREVEVKPGTFGCFLLFWIAESFALLLNP